VVADRNRQNLGESCILTIKQPCNMRLRSRRTRPAPPEHLRQPEFLVPRAVGRGAKKHCQYLKISKFRGSGTPARGRGRRLLRLRYEPASENVFVPACNHANPLAESHRVTTQFEVLFSARQERASVAGRMTVQKNQLGGGLNWFGGTDRSITAA